jgi:hypothetical protein
MDFICGLIDLPQPIRCQCGHGEKQHLCKEGVALQCLVKYIHRHLHDLEGELVQRLHPGAVVCHYIWVSADVHTCIFFPLCFGLEQSVCESSLP